MTIKIYVEGAGPRRVHHSECRRAFARFFESAGIGQKKPSVIPCGGRHAAFEAFRIAAKTRDTSVVPVLLVDAEVAVDERVSSWQHLREHDGWERPHSAGDDQVFLMVEVMETWFLADLDALAEFFGPCFVRDAARKWPALEKVPKPTIYEVLDKATAECKQSYRKGHISFELLSRLDARKVEAACPHAKALLEYLRRA